MSRLWTWLIGCLAFALALVVVDARAQHAGHGAAPGAAAPRTFTMEELHRSGGVPRGWRFTFPAGDPEGGREVFRAMKCYTCHTIKGENFPPPGGDEKTAGPELTGMGGRHPVEYLAESILVPDAVLLDGPGFTGPDGRSIMPTYEDSLSVTQLIDLVAFLKSLTDAGQGHGAALLEKTAGDYTVRLEYRTAGDGHGGHGARPARGHLMAFVSDRETREAVPYLPVTATIRITGKPARIVKLAPMVGDQGFHYAANVTLPDGTQKITLSIGRTTMQLMESAKGRFVKPVTVVFDWGQGHEER